AGWIVACIRIDDVVCADHDRDVCSWKFGIDLLELVERGIRNVCFGEQHVHVSGHPACYRMDSIFDGYAALLEHVCEFAHCVLRLRGGEPVTRHEHDFVGIGELGSDVVQTDFAHRAFLLATGGGSGRASESAEQNVCHRTVHRAAHQDRKYET